MPQQMPPMREIALALRKTTEILAQELAAPSNEPPSWTQFEWRIARAVAAMQGMSVLFCGGLRWQGPESWRRFLCGQRDQSIARHTLITGLLRSIDGHAREAGVPLVGLKGAALLGKGIYAPGERPMGDIDLLVRSEDAAAVGGILDACGYAALMTNRRHQVFQSRIANPPMAGRLGEHVGNPLRIEVHTRIAEQLPVALVDISSFLISRAPGPGLNDYPSDAALMMHLLLHAAGNMRARALRLIQLHDIALLANRLTASNWQELLTMRVGGRMLWWAFAPLMLTVRYYPGCVPPGPLRILGAQTPWLLRKYTRRQQLTDVSWSNIRIEAFPGVEWSRTPSEALAFMKSRLLPSREARLELQDGAAQIPGSAAVPWYGISHGARILRWMFSKPPRVQTLLSVRAALAQES
jgi:hypothetical protein